LKKNALLLFFYALLLLLFEMDSLFPAHLHPLLTEEGPQRREKIMLLWLLLLVIFYVVPTVSNRMFSSAAVHGSTRVSAGQNGCEVRQTSLRCSAPISTNGDTNIGLKYSLSKIKSLPDFLFVKHKFKTPDGSSSVDAQWNFDAKVCLFVHLCSLIK
jgi:hypothetical protein